MSYAFLVDAALLPVTLLSWCLASSDLLSLLLSYAVKKTSIVALELPYSRELEIEADFLGLAIMALVRQN